MSGHSEASVSAPIAEVSGPIQATLRVFALSMTTTAFAFIFNAYLSFWWDAPGVLAFFNHIRGVEGKALEGAQAALGWVQFGLYAVAVAGVVFYVMRNYARTMHEDSESLNAIAAFIVRAAFWAVLLTGLVDMVISFLRVEGLLLDLVGETLNGNLGRSSFRGTYVHYPLIVVSIIIAAFTRALGFPWLALLIVGAEVQIVISRFVFSYEQAFMGDLVRYWYGALFLFASAYTLIEEGHVRVDIVYAGLKERGKAWTNTLGCAFLGLPLCWIILTLGMWGKSSIISAPLINFEVSQSGYGLYVKYFMAGLLLIFAISMLVQFMGYFLRNAAVLLHEPGYHPDLEEHAAI